MPFNTALSGIHAANADLGATSHNIANANTTGFKESRAEFSDIFQSTSYGLAQNAIGAGVRLSNVAQQFSQGNINPTGRNMDLAISGEGFFTVSINGTRAYSRAGNFHSDREGYIINPQGARLQAFPSNSTGDGFDAGNLIDLKLQSSTNPPKASSRVQLGLTLPANAKAPQISPFDPADSKTWNHSSGGVTVYDSLGVSHLQTSYFVKTDTPNEWQMYTAIDGELLGDPATLTFSETGSLLEPQDGQVALATFTPKTGAGTLDVTLELGSSAQYGETFVLRGSGQNGYPSGKLNEISIDKTGIVYARYSNNADLALGQIALTTFANPQGLQQQGNNLWSQSYASGEPRTGAPGTSDFGAVESGALEASTVDLTEQLVNMIVAQRNFQANAQMISTQDQTTQTILNMR